MRWLDKRSWVSDGRCVAYVRQVEQARLGVTRRGIREGICTKNYLTVRRTEGVHLRHVWAVPMACRTEVSINELSHRDAPVIHGDVKK